MASRSERIAFDIKEVVESPDAEGICLSDVENMYNFNAHLAGPIDSPYSSGCFEVNIVVPRDYPYSPPTIQFVTKVFHPNVDSATGEICLDRLKDEWKPAIRLIQILDAVRGLLRNPNPDSPLDICSSVMMREDMAMFQKTALMWTHHFANGTKLDEEYNEKIQILAALGMSNATAIRKLTKARWNTEKVVEKMGI